MLTGKSAVATLDGVGVGVAVMAGKLKHTHYSMPRFDSADVSRLLR